MYNLAQTSSLGIKENPVAIFWLQPFRFEDLDGFIYCLGFVRSEAAGEQHNTEYGGDSCFHGSRYRSSLITELATAGDEWLYQSKPRWGGTSPFGRKVKTRYRLFLPITLC